MPFNGREAKARRDSTFELKTHINIVLFTFDFVFYILSLAYISQAGNFFLTSGYTM